MDIEPAPEGHFIPVEERNFAWSSFRQGESEVLNWQEIMTRPTPGGRSARHDLRKLGDFC